MPNSKEDPRVLEELRTIWQSNLPDNDSIMLPTQQPFLTESEVNGSMPVSLVPDINPSRRDRCEASATDWAQRIQNVGGAWLTARPTLKWVKASPSERHSKDSPSAGAKVFSTNDDEPLVIRYGYDDESPHVLIRHLSYLHMGEPKAGEGIDYFTFLPSELVTGEDGFTQLVLLQRSPATSPFDRRGDSRFTLNARLPQTEVRDFLNDTVREPYLLDTLTQQLFSYFFDNGFIVREQAARLCFIHGSQLVKKAQAADRYHTNASWVLDAISRHESSNIGETRKTERYSVRAIPDWDIIPGEQANQDRIDCSSVAFK